MASLIVPQIFRKSPVSTTTYDWQDATLNVGYRTYYGACSNMTAGDYRFLSPTNNLDSTTNGGIMYSIGANSTMDVDFDITFQSPADVAAGKAYINFTYSSNNLDTISIAVTIYHVDGVTSAETSLGTGTSAINADDGSGNWFRELLYITTTTKHFAKGDILRVNFYGQTEAAEEINLYHDPSSSLTHTDQVSGRTVGSDMVIMIPFRIDI